MRDAFFDSLYNVAKRDKQVILINSDTGALVLDEFRRDHGDRCINVGIAEENMIGIAAGLAMSGKIVYTYAIIPFVTMRCYEQIRIDVCCQDLPVKMVGVGAGMDYSILGPTHHGTEDIALMRSLPEMTILSPSDNNMAATFAQISYDLPGPVYVRLDRTGTPLIYNDQKQDFSEGANILRKNGNLCIIATGRMVARALEVAEVLTYRYSINTGIVDLYRIKPLNEELLLEAIGKSKYVATLEEHFVTGGIGSAIAEMIAERQLPCRFKRLAMPDKFVREYGSREYLHGVTALDTKSVTDSIVGWVST